jgi:TatD DNase family protein
MNASPMIDSHCHIDFDVFDKDRDDVLQRAKTHGVSRLVVPGVLRKNWSKIQTLSTQYENIHPCYGLHPCFADQHSENDLAALENQITSNVCVAVGECGLDYRKHQPEKELQSRFFEAQLEIANKYQLPVVIHSVYATEDVIQSLKRYTNLQGMVHSYSGSYEQAMQLVKMGFYISFGGIITYDNACKLRIVAEEVPLNSLLIETDSPDQPDADHFAQRNEPAYLVNILDCLSGLREESKDQIAEQTTANARALFNI